MKLKIATTIMFGLFLWCMSLHNAFAQAPDTVDVPVVIDGTPLGAINKFIQGDTTATGERSNPNRVYRLARGQIYFLDGMLMAQGYHLRIMGEPEDPANPMKPATLAPGIRADGSFTNILMQARGDLTVENVYFMGRAPTGAQDIMQSVNWAIQVAKDEGRIELNNCNFEWIRRHCVAINSQYNDVFISNCYFRNNQAMAGWWGGAGVVTNNNPADSVVFVNNTFVNCNCLLFNVANNTVNYSRIEHNTLVNTLNEFTLWLWGSDATFSNNIFYNIHSIGETLEDMSTHDPDALPWGTVNVDTIPADFIAQLDISEQDRKIEVNNNCYFHDPKIIDFWNSIDTLYGEPWMNERTQAMFADDESYPYLLTGNNVNTDPQFSNPPGNLDLMLQWMTHFREFASTPNYHWGWDPDDDGFNIEWPLPEDFSYPETSELYTGGSGGFPIGDLNWFPDKKAEWEDQQMVAVEDDSKKSAIAKDFQLFQNYPNPFNPVTEISYQLKTTGRVKLTVYNMLGQQVTELVNTIQTAGVHRVHWNGTDDAGHRMSSGIYYYQIVTDGFIATKKMLLLR